MSRGWSAQAQRAWRAMRVVPAAIYKGGGAAGAARRAMAIFRRSGVRGVARSLGVLLRGEGPPLMADPTRADRHQYREWVKRHDAPLQDHARARMAAQAASWAGAPSFALWLKVGADVDAAPRLARTIASVRAQAYPHWTLWLCGAGVPSSRWDASDAHIRIASAPTELEAGDPGWFGRLDAGDRLAHDALFRLAEAIQRDPAARLVYSDEDRIGDDGQRSAPFFKPDWNPDLLLSQNYLDRLTVVESTWARACGGLPASADPVAEYDFVLRCTERLQPAQIVHVPKVLYHRRVEPAADAHATDGRFLAPPGGEEALRRHFERIGREAAVTREGIGYRVRYPLPAAPPLVSLIIPTRNGLRLVRQCIESILQKTRYPSFEIILVDNGSDDPAALAYFQEVAEHSGVRVLRDSSPFNYSALNNQAAAIARGSVLGLINNDIEVISPDWLDEMVGIALQPGVGAVGARLWYPDRTLQHGGVVLGYRGGVADHAHRRLAEGDPGYFGRAALTQTFSVVTAACLVVRKALYDEVGGLDAAHLKVAYNDVDFCLRLREIGCRNVWTPHAELFHHESATRPSDLSPQQIERFLGEENYMKQRWGELLFNDPAYNPNLSLQVEDFSYAWPPRTAWSFEPPHAP
jgi:GT2 family glycosyltransferase